MIFPDLGSIKQRRIKLGVNQKKIAEMCRISQSLIAKVESSKLEPSYEIVKRIFNVLDSLEHKGEKKCFDVMSRKIISIRKRELVEKASELMKNKGVSQLPVIDGKRVVGSIDEGSIIDAIVNGDKKEVFRMKVEEIMSGAFPTVNGETPVSVIIPLLKVNGAILVMDREDIVGIITKSNVL